MTKAPDQKTARQIEEEACTWVAKVDRDSTLETAHALAAWLKENPRHRVAFLRISTAWRRANALRRLREPGEVPDPDLLAPERPPADESITEPAQAQPRIVNAAPARRVQPGKVALFASAAGLAAALLAGAWTWFHLATGTTYSTAIGEFHRVTLADGSSLSLNTNSKVRVYYSDSERKVELLRGEAQFDVAHDDSRPFLVMAGDTVVRDVGTVFDVRLRSSSSVDVLVSEGVVAINPPARATVTAGHMALVRNGKITTFPVNDITRRMAWLDGKLVFDGQTLLEAVTEFNRYNRQRLVISDPSIASKKIGGAFKSTNPERFGRSMKNLGVELQVDENTFGSEIHLYSGAP